MPVLASPLDLRYSVRKLSSEQFNLLKSLAIHLEIEGKDKFIIPFVFTKFSDEENAWICFSPIQNQSDEVQQQILDSIKEYQIT